MRNCVQLVTSQNTAVYRYYGIYVTVVSLYYGWTFYFVNTAQWSLFRPVSVIATDINNQRENSGECWDHESRNVDSTETCRHDWGLWMLSEPLLYSNSSLHWVTVTSTCESANERSTSPLNERTIWW